MRRHIGQPHWARVVFLLLVIAGCDQGSLGPDYSEPPPRPSFDELSGDEVIYGVNKSSEVVEINLAAQTFEVVDNLSVGTAASDQDPETGRLYYFEMAVNGENGDRLLYWDPATGTNTTVRIYTPPTQIYMKRMAFAPDNTLYMSDDSDVMYTIDKTTGDLTTLGPVSGMDYGVPGIGGDMAFLPDGTLYAVNGDHLFTVDLATLTATTVTEEIEAVGEGGTVGFTGMGYCKGSLYGYGVVAFPPPYDASSFTEAGIWSIDPATGVGTRLWTTWPPDPHVMLNDLGSCVGPADPGPDPDVTDPVVTITSPTTADTYATQTSTVSLGGTASDDTGVTSVTWVNDRGGSGTASGTQNWTVGAVALASGENRITVTAEDAAGNSSIDELVVTYSPPNQPPTATILLPSDGATAGVGQSISYAGAGTDPEDGDLPASAFTWEAARVGGRFRPLAQGTTEGTVVIPASGNFILRLTVVDSGGLTDSAQVTVTFIR
jgi:hypothetical protein